MSDEPGDPLAELSNTHFIEKPVLKKEEISEEKRLQKQIEKEQR